MQIELQVWPLKPSHCWKNATHVLDRKRNDYNMHVLSWHIDFRVMHVLTQQNDVQCLIKALDVILHRPTLIAIISTVNSEEIYSDDMHSQNNKSC